MRLLEPAVTDATLAAGDTACAPAEARAEPVLSVVRLAGLSIQLALAVGVIWSLQIEGAGFRRLSLLILAGFIVHALVPLAWRLGAFLALSLVAIPLVLGVADGAWLLAAASVLAGICLAPVPIRWRVALLAAVGLLLAGMRAGWLLDPLPDIVWPILGAMFAFRVLVFLYDASHATRPIAPLKGLAYFFLLPNVCFPLFPVVDFKTFDRSHYAGEAYAIYQRGLSWIARGLLHLVLYRVVYHELVLDVSQLRDAGDLLRYVFTVFLLYLRVSGQFHLIIGVLLLFGFNLPETNHHYFLATSFTDIWRRINIYWKDMMMKLVYYPSFFVFRRRWSQATSLTLATAAVFVVTWALHSYLWFWARGALLLSVTDTVFWVALGALVICSSLREQRAGKQRTMGPGPWGWTLGRGLRTLGVFSLMSFLWSLWSAESFGVWVGAVSTLPTLHLDEGLIVLALAGAFVGLAGWNWEALGQRKPVQADWRAAMVPTGLLCGLLAVGPLGGVAWMPAPLARYMSVLKKTGLNQADQDRMGRNYYQVINESGGRGFREQEPGPTNPWLVLHTGNAYRPRPDFLTRELTPGTNLTIDGLRFTVNSQGLRDREYSQAKPNGVRRWAVVGSSVFMGYGVGDGTSFEAVLEGMLAQDSTLPPHELLNFSAGGLSQLQAVFVAEHRTQPYEPDLLLLGIYEPDGVFLAQHLQRVLDQGVAIPYPEVVRIVEQAGLRSRMPEVEVLRRLGPWQDELSRAAFRRLAALGRERGIPVVVTAIRLPLDQPGTRLGGYIQMAREEGLEILDLRDVWSGRDEARLVVSPQDHHPNAEGHRLLAERLLLEFKARPALLGLQAGHLAASATTPAPQ